MESSSSSISFKQLIALVKQLTAEEKKVLIKVLTEENNFLVNEDAVADVKGQEQIFDFDKSWQESMSTKEFEKATHNHINTLPWK